MLDADCKAHIRQHFGHILTSLFFPMALNARKCSKKSNEIFRKNETFHATVFSKIIYFNRVFNKVTSATVHDSVQLVSLSTFAPQNVSKNTGNEKSSVHLKYLALTLWLIFYIYRYYFARHLLGKNLAGRHMFGV